MKKTTLFLALLASIPLLLIGCQQKKQHGSNKKNSGTSTEHMDEDNQKN